MATKRRPSRRLRRRFLIEPLESRNLLAGVGNLIRVDLNDPTDDFLGCGDEDNPCNTIQVAIDIAQADDRIQIAPGTYVENVSIGQNLTLSGASEVVGSNQRLVTIQSVDPGLAAVSVTSTADCVVIESLNVTDGQAGIVATDVDFLTIRNVGASSNDTGLMVLIGGDLTVQGGVFEDNSESGLLLGDLTGKLKLEKHLLDKVTIRDNSEKGLLGGSLVDVELSDVEVSRNGEEGILLEDVRDVVVRDVVSKENGRVGLLIDGARDVSDTKGQYTENDGDGVRLVDITGDVKLLETKANDNDHDDNDVGAGLRTDFTDEAVSIGGTLTIDDAEFNDQFNGLTVRGVTGQIAIGTSSANGNGKSGLTIRGPRADVLIKDTSAQDNSEDGLYVTGGPGEQLITVDGGMFKTNQSGVRVDIADAGVLLDGPVVSGNVVGVDISDANSVTVKNVDNRDNDDYGILLTDVVGDVALTSVTLEDNNKDGNETGWGLRALRAAETVAIGGTLTISGGRVADTTPLDGTTNQATGVEVDGVGGNVDIQGADVRGHEAFGLAILEVAGTLNISTTTLFKNGIGALAANVQGASTLTSINAEQNSDVAVTLSDASDVVIDGGTYKKNGTGVALMTVNEVMIRNNAAITESVNAGMTIDGSDTVDVHSGTFSGTTGGSGLVLESTGDIQIIDGTADGNQENGFSILPNPALPLPTVSIQGGSLSNNGNNCGLPCGNGLFTDGTAGLILTGVSANGNLHNGVQIRDPAAVTIDGGQFNQNTNGAGINVFGAAVLMLKNNVSADRNGGHGILADPDGSGTSLDIAGGVYTNNGNDGIRARDFETVTIAGAAVNNNQGQGLVVEPVAAHTNHVDVSNTSFSNNTGGNGLQLTTIEKLTLNGVTASGNSGGGLSAVSHGKNPATITGGAYDNNLSNAGIRLSGFTDIDLLGAVSASGNSLSGVSIDSTAQGPGQVDIAGGAFNGQTAGPGLDLRGTTVLVAGGFTANQNANQGLTLDSSGQGGANVDLSNAGVSDNGQGIQLQGTVFARLDEVSANGNGGTGLLVAEVAGGASVQIEGGSYSNNSTGDGIRLSAPAQVVVDGTVADANRESGLDVEAGSSPAGGIAVSDSFFRSNINEDGVQLSNTGVVLLANVVSDDNGGRGVAVNDGGAIGIDDGSLSSNSNGGARLIDVAGVTFRNGTSIDGNGSDGVFVLRGEEVVITGASLSSNNGAGLNSASTQDVTLDGVTASFNSAEGILIDNAASVGLADGAANGNDRGFVVSNASQVSLVDFAVLGNDSDVGGAVNNVPIFQLASTGDIVDEVTATADTLDIVQRTEPPVFLDSILFSNVTTVRLDGGEGDDLVNLTPSTSTTFELDGNLPHAPAKPGDTLILDALGNDVTADESQIVVSGFQPVKYVSIETFKLNNRTRPWQNPFNPLDVDRDGRVVPKDVLLVINDLNQNNSRKLPEPPLPPDEPPPFLDVNGDGSLSPVDALLVINFLNGASGEGEALEIESGGNWYATTLPGDTRAEWADRTTAYRDDVAVTPPPPAEVAAPIGRPNSEFRRDRPSRDQHDDVWQDQDAWWKLS